MAIGCWMLLLLLLLPMLMENVIAAQD